MIILRPRNSKTLWDLRFLYYSKEIASDGINNQQNRAILVEEQIELVKPDKVV